MGNLIGNLMNYQYLVQDLICNFSLLTITTISRLQNSSAYLMANMPSKLIPPKDFNLHRFSIGLIFKPSIPCNITNLLVFNDDSDIINFLTSEGIYKNDVIHEQAHDLEINKSFKGDNLKTKNIIPESVVNLEDI